MVSPTAILKFTSLLSKHACRRGKWLKEKNHITVSELHLGVVTLLFWMKALTKTHWSHYYIAFKIHRLGFQTCVTLHCLAKSCHNKKLGLLTVDCAHMWQTYWLRMLSMRDAGQRVQSSAQDCRAALWSAGVPALTEGSVPSPRGYAPTNTLSKCPIDFNRSWKSYRLSVDGHKYQ